MSAAVPSAGDSRPCGVNVVHQRAESPQSLHKAGGSLQGRAFRQCQVVAEQLYERPVIDGGQEVDQEWLAGQHVPPVWLPAPQEFPPASP